VRSELAALPHSQREVIVLRYFAGLSDSQIALELDQPIGTVKSHLRRGLEQMRKAFT
jgi:RNA polymerase sigma-70 factor (ECF subfamily)